MKRKNLLSLIVVGSFIFGAARANAVSVSLDLVTTTIAVGDPVLFSLNMDFTDEATLGGGFDIFFDPSVLEFSSFIFDAGFGDDPALRRVPDVITGELNGIGFGNFNGLVGPSKIGELSFIALSDGLTTVSLQANDSLIPGPFVSASTFNEQVVTFSGAEITIAPVPLPSALMLFGSAFSLLLVTGRRHIS